MSTFLAKSVNTMCVTAVTESKSGSIFFHCINSNGTLTSSQSVELPWMKKHVEGDYCNVCFATPEIAALYEWAVKKAEEK